jgi:hypothetical protein
VGLPAFAGTGFIYKKSPLLAGFWVLVYFELLPGVLFLWFWLFGLPLLLRLGLGGLLWLFILLELVPWMGVVVDFFDLRGAKMGVYLCCAQRLMAKEFLYASKVGSVV